MEDVIIIKGLINLDDDQKATLFDVLAELDLDYEVRAE